MPCENLVIGGEKSLVYISTCSSGGRWGEANFNELFVSRWWCGSLSYDWLRSLLRLLFNDAKVMNLFLTCLSLVNRHDESWGLAWVLGDLRFQRSRVIEPPMQADNRRLCSTNELIAMPLIWEWLLWLPECELDQNKSARLCKKWKIRDTSG